MLARKWKQATGNKVWLMLGMYCVETWIRCTARDLTVQAYSIYGTRTSSRV